MKKFKKYPVNRTRDDSRTTGGHIHFLHILAFASESADFTEKENAHFDVCHACRLKLADALRNVAPRAIRTIMTKAA
jgi:hypothetical protein